MNSHSIKLIETGISNYRPEDESENDPDYLARALIAAAVSLRFVITHYGNDEFPDRMRAFSDRIEEAVECLRADESLLPDYLYGSRARALAVLEDLKLAIMYKREVPRTDELIKSFSDAFRLVVEARELLRYHDMDITEQELLLSRTRDVTDLKDAPALLQFYITEYRDDELPDLMGAFSDRIEEAVECLLPDKSELPEGLHGSRARALSVLEDLQILVMYKLAIRGLVQPTKPLSDALRLVVEARKLLPFITMDIRDLDAALWPG